MFNNWLSFYLNYPLIGVHGFDMDIQDLWYFSTVSMPRLLDVSGYIGYRHSYFDLIDLVAWVVIVWFNW